MLNTIMSTDHKIYMNTCMEIFNTFSKEQNEIIITQQETNTQMYNKVIQVNLTKTIDDLREKYHTSEYLLSATNKYKNEIENFATTIEIAKVGEQNISINQAIDIVENLFKEMKSKFFGALLISNKKQMINPFHPLIAKEISRNKLDVEKKQYTLAIYTYKENYNQDEEFNKQLDFVDEIINLLATTDMKSKYIKKQNNFEIYTNEYSEYEMKFEEEIYDTKTNTKMSDDFSFEPKYLIPIQVLNKGGVPYPYYGYVYTVNGVAWNISPMYSANISRPGTSGNPKSGSRVCSKIGSAKTVKGISALSHSNLTSPLNSSIVRDGWREYARDSFEIGFAFYRDINIKEEPSKPLTLKVFLTKNPSSTRKDYITYLKTELEKQKQWNLEHLKKEEDDQDNNIQQ